MLTSQQEGAQVPAMYKQAELHAHISTQPNCFSIPEFVMAHIGYAA